MNRYVLFLFVMILVLNNSRVNGTGNEREMINNLDNSFELIELNDIPGNIVIFSNTELTSMAKNKEWNGSGVDNDPYQIKTERENSSIIIWHTNLAISITDQTFNETTIQLFDTSNIEISFNNFKDTYIDIFNSQQILVLKNQMSQAKLANGWQPLIEIDNSVGIDIFDNSYYGSSSRSYFLSSDASAGVEIENNVMEIESFSSVFIDFTQTVQIFIINNTLISNGGSMPFRIKSSNLIILENNNFQSTPFDIWAVNDISFINNIINQSSIRIISSILIDFNFNEIEGIGIDIGGSAIINITENSFSDCSYAITLSGSSDYTLKNNKFENIRYSNILINPSESEAGSLNNYLIFSSIMINVILGFILIRNKDKTKQMNKA